jgi:chaperonin GroEL
MFHLLEGLLAKGVRKLLVICENVQGEMLATLIENKIRGAFTCVVVQKPFEPEMLEDIAALTGADTLVGAKLTGELNEGHILSLGKAKKVIVRKDKTIIIGGAGKKEKVEERMNALKGEMATTASDYRREGLRERVAKMAGSLVLIKVGAPTESDMKYMKDKVDDAVSATRAALAEGILPGGGRVLYDISHAKPKNDGEEVVFYACGQCIRKIIENSGEKVDDILALLKEGEVWDALDNKICTDPMKSGLIDPAKVERCALKNAVSAAGLFITMGSVIVELPRKIVKEMV